MNEPGFARSRVMRRFALVFGLLALTATVVACGSSSSGKATDSPAAAEITISNFMFKPATLTVKPGTTVTVKNADDTQHTATANNGAFDTGAIDGGKSATFTVTKAGTISYHCNIHNYMTGTIQVSG